MQAQLQKYFNLSYKDFDEMSNEQFVLEYLKMKELNRLEREAAEKITLKNG